MFDLEDMGCCMSLAGRIRPNDSFPRMCGVAGADAPCSAASEVRRSALTRRDVRRGRERVGRASPEMCALVLRARAASAYDWLGVGLVVFGRT